MEWVAIKGYEGRYEVNRAGEIRTLNWRGTGQIRPLRTARDKKGYHRTVLTIGRARPGNSITIKLHRVIAQTFIANPEAKPQVNHRNGDKNDNSVENLEWATNTENMRHSWASGLHKPPVGAKNPNAKLEVTDADKIRRLYETGFFRQVDLAEMFGVNQTAISSVVRGKTWA